MIKYIILTCEKYHNTRLKVILETWGKDIDITFISDVAINDKIIGYDYLPKDYSFLSLRYIEYIKTLNEINYDWYIFADDDTFINIDNINKLLENKDRNSLISFGHTGELNIDGTDANGNQTGFPLSSIKGKNTLLPLTYYSGGAGFILSNISMRKISEYIKMSNIDEIPSSYNSDVTFGFWLMNNNIEINDIKGFWWTNPDDLKHNDSQLVESYSYHYIDEKNMKLLYEKLHNNAS
jgi:hypothetical protein